MSERENAGSVPIIERAYCDGLWELMRSEPMQRLLADRVDVVEITAAKTYAGRASMRRGRRLIRLSMRHRLQNDEMAFIICHELAHHEVGLGQQHSDEWREACAELAREAGELGLLSRRRVKEAVRLALDGTATMFRGWPAQAQKFEEDREAAQAKLRAQLIEAGVRVGGMIGFEYRGRPVRGEVIRINTTTISVGEKGGDRTLMRVPFSRVRTIYVDRPPD
ncbi:MAG: SprT-like domain-containing protein [Armatimonadota bacterium]|jgi:hypothetical protein